MVNNKVNILAILFCIFLLCNGIVTANIFILSKNVQINSSDNGVSGPFFYENKIKYELGDFVQEGIASDDSGQFFISTAFTLFGGKISVASLSEDELISSEINGISEIEIGWHPGDPFCDDEFLFVPWIDWNGITDPSKAKCYVYRLSDLAELENSPFDLKMNEHYLPGASSGAYYQGYYYFSSYFPTNVNSRMYKFSFDENQGFTYEFWSQNLGKSEVQGIEFFDDKCYFVRAHGSDPHVYWISTKTWDENNLGMQNIKKYSQNSNGPYEGITFDASQNRVIAYFGFGNYCFESFENTNCFSDANLDCKGSIEFNRANPGQVVNTEFKIYNKGTKDSLLNWEIVDSPDWTIFCFEPISSDSPGQNPIEFNKDITVNVEIIIPNGQTNTFKGVIKVANKENPADYCNIDVEITIKNSREYSNIIFNKIINRFEILAHFFINVY